MSIDSITQSVTRPTLIQYADVLVQIDRIIAEYSQVDSEAIRAEKARSLVSLLYLLHDMQAAGLTGSPVMSNFVQTILDRAKPLMQSVLSSAKESEVAAAMDCFVYSTIAGETATDLLSRALTPENWVGSNGRPIKIQDALADYLFFEYYRHAESSMLSSMGQLANRLEVSKGFLNALSDLYQGTTWNPGSSYINLKGELQDYIDSQGQYHSWFNEFTNNSTSDQDVGYKMRQGAINLQTMLDSGLFPEGSIELETANYVLELFDLPVDEGGFGQVSTADGALRMWSDRRFKMTLQNSIDASSRLNEQRQLELARLLNNYEFFLRSATNIVNREGQMVRELALHIKDL